MATYNDLNNLSSDSDIATALGDMVVAWANAETTLMHAMCSICNMSTNMAHFGYYRIPTFEARVKFLLAMIPEWDTSSDRDAISKAIEKISGMSGTRNNWVHGIWSKEKTTGQVVVFNFRAAENKGRNKPVKAHDINHHVETLIANTKALRKLLPPLP
ncbi:hypothetical protein NKJ72_27340 [Mesorhizobium sp. M0045]|uniref:hypothetical protein n=1 Tax=unclassified Mesorhizobium TaxID=325217 RepID=UPI003337F2EC